MVQGVSYSEMELGIVEWFPSSGHGVATKQQEFLV